MKLTPFFEKMAANGAKMVEFTGYFLPIQFESSGIIAEHKAVREKAGLFDVSHMGELMLTGKDAFATIQSLVTNDITSMKDGQARYTLLPNEKGGIVDDILIYRFNEQKYMLVVNAANCAKDDQWISSRLLGDTVFENISERTAQLAIQGRAAEDIIKEFITVYNVPEKNYTFKVSVLFGEEIILSRTGYTGEDGFELYCSDKIAEQVFDLVVEKGNKHGMLLCGLGARDTLRMEASMPLYGHEMTDETLATELGLDFFIKLNKDFVGKQALLDKAPLCKRIGVRLVDRGIAREKALVFDSEDKEIGCVTSGTHSPTLGYPIAMLRVDRDFDGKEVYIDVRGKKLKAEVVPMPFYKKNY
ncbi:MAG: glycine cleavage system aminomethyltransferase GcvT [Clostridia bacterium]|nr:glycine cleavage system aminomethyltransferase GcvT [Clostridia bacterium]